MTWKEAVNVLVGCQKKSDWKHTDGMIQEASKIAAEIILDNPLTLNELREMDEKPVLLETGEVSSREQLVAKWEILIGHDDDVFFFTRRNRGFSAKNYGLTWLVYRCE